MAMTRAASEPTVPGALGLKPEPNQVDRRVAGVRGGRWPRAVTDDKNRSSVPLLGLVIFGLRRFRLQGLGGDCVFAGRPVGQIGDAATLAAERKVGVAEMDFFLADGTIHTPIWTSCGSNRGAGSVAGRSVPTTS